MVMPASWHAAGASPLRVKRGDRFAVAISDGEDGALPTVWCSDRTLLQNLRVGALLWVDDGKIGCVVEQAGDERALLRVTAAREKGNLLKPGKGSAASTAQRPPPCLRRRTASISISSSSTPTWSAIPSCRRPRT